MPGYTRRHLRRDIIKEMILRECACQDQEEMRADHGVKFHNNGPEEESGMIRSNLYTLSKQAQEMHDMIGMNDDLDEWVQEKISVASSMIDSVYDYIGYEYKSMKGDVGSHDSYNPDLMYDDEHHDEMDTMDEADDREFDDLDADEVMREPWEPLHQSTGIMFFEEDEPVSTRRRR